MYIPDEWLPPVTVVGNDMDGNPMLKVPPLGDEYQRGVRYNKNPEYKARFYLKQAMQSLALAKYWLEETKEAENGTD